MAVAPVLDLTAYPRGLCQHRVAHLASRMSSIGFELTRPQRPVLSAKRAHAADATSSISISCPSLACRGKCVWGEVGVSISPLALHASHSENAREVRRQNGLHEHPQLAGAESAGFFQSASASPSASPSLHNSGQVQASKSVQAGVEIGRREPGVVDSSHLEAASAVIAPDAGRGEEQFRARAATHGRSRASVEGAPEQNAQRVSRRSLALFLPLLAAVSTTSQAAAQVTAAPPLPPSDVAPPPAPPPSSSSPCQTEEVRLEILDGGSLGVSIFPDFEYNPSGSGGGTAAAVPLGGGRLHVAFDASALVIPPLSFQSTNFVGLPLPPPLMIRIVPTLLSGVIDRNTGQVDLTFKSKFYFTAGPIYSAPPLEVEAVLTTESSVGSIREGHGARLDKDGKGRLAAVAVVPAVNDGFLNRFLSLPTEVLAVLPAKFTFDC